MWGAQGRGRVVHRPAAVPTIAGGWDGGRPPPQCCYTCLPSSARAAARPLQAVYGVLKEAEHRSTFYIPYWNLPLAKYLGGCFQGGRAERENSGLSGSGSRAGYVGWVNVYGLGERCASGTGDKVANPVRGGA